MTGELPVPALPSATMMLLRQRETVEILMVKRGKEAFFGSALVFPGGKLDAHDQSEDWTELLEGAAELDGLERALRVAGWRELYEETGLLPFAKADAMPPGEQDFAGLVRGLGQKLPLGGMVPFARWITPSRAPKRFDTYFYLCALDGDDAVCDGFETVAAEWISPRKALELGEARERLLLFPTKAQLRRLAEHESIEAIFAAARANVVVPIEPRPVKRDGRIFITIPPGLGYAICEDEFIKG